MMKYILIYFYLINIVNSENVVCPSGCICDMTNGLRSARCNNEQLTTVEADIPPEVQYLDLADNMISNLENYIFRELKLQNIIVLNISTNRISDISLRAFVGLKYLQIVDVSDNVLQTLSPEIFETNIHLTKLYLAGNKFTNLKPEPFLNSNSLEILDVSRCLISHIQADFFLKLPSLHTIDISQNFLIQLDAKIFDNVPNLKKLKLYDNKIDCNTKTIELLQYLQTHQVIYDNICQKIEKSQKMILIDDVPLEKDNLLNWSFDNCDIETNENDIKATDAKCQIIYDNKMMSAFLFSIVFAGGLLIGVFLACSYVSCAYIVKKKSRSRNMNNRIIRTRRPSIVRRPRDEFLLAENSFDIGLSTPVLSRARQSTVIK